MKYILSTQADERGAAIVEFILALPLFLILLCTIVEAGGFLIAYAAVDDAAYSVAHAYAVDSELTTDQLQAVAATGPLSKADAETLSITSYKYNDAANGAPNKRVYTHHLPNSAGEEKHTLYHDKWVFHVEYKMAPLTLIGSWIAGEKGYIPISSDSICVVDRTSELTKDPLDEYPNGWWNTEE